MVEEIDAESPIGVGVVWAVKEGGHAVTLFGYLKDPPMIMVGDPWFGDSWMRYPAFPGRYEGGGFWMETGYTS